eukprot:COSAG04_NODE_3049_length_3236_cov_26.473063_2_plen_303_part_00
MPGKGGAQIVCSECAQNDRVQRGARLGTVVRVQTVSDGPNGVCSATEVTVRWDDGETVALNPMAPRGQPESPSGVVWQQAPDEIAQELIRLAAEEAAVDKELHRTLSDIARLESRGSRELEPEPEPEPEPERDREAPSQLARSLTQDVFSRLLEHPGLSKAERSGLRSMQQERRRARQSEQAEPEPEEEEDDGAGTGLFFDDGPEPPQRTWYPPAPPPPPPTRFSPPLYTFHQPSLRRSEERLDAASTELAALQQLQHGRPPASGPAGAGGLARLPSTDGGGSALESVWVQIAALRAELGLG